MIKGRAALLLLALALSLLGLALLPSADVYLPPGSDAALDLRTTGTLIFVPIITSNTTQEQLLDLINAERRSRNLGGLRINGTLMQVAGEHSLDMATHDYLSHVNLEGEHSWDRLDRAGYDWSYMGEVIAGGSTSPQIAFAGWMSSPLHKAVLLNPVYKEIGAGYSFNADTYYGHYWVCLFAVPEGE